MKKILFLLSLIVLFAGCNEVPLVTTSKGTYSGDPTKVCKQTNLWVGQAGKHGPRPIYDCSNTMEIMKKASFESFN